jgi:hypothetical protein
MFQLTDAILERIIFAMEDQSKKLLIDLETGDLIDKTTIENEDSPELYSEMSHRFVEPPSWDSRRGFSILEAFASTVTSPTDIKMELNAALRRGKGVFKQFRQVLSKDQDIFKRYQEFKLAAMRPIVERWLEALQEGEKLTALKEEPEDLRDIIASDIDFIVSSLDGIVFKLESYINYCIEESFGSLPIAIKMRSLSDLLELVKTDSNSVHIAMGTIDGVSPLIAGLFSLQAYKGSPICVVHGVFGTKESLMLDLEWPIIECISEYCTKIGATQILLEGPFFSSLLCDSALEYGFSQSGTIFHKNL